MTRAPRGIDVVTHAGREIDVGRTPRETDVGPARREIADACRGGR